MASAAFFYYWLHSLVTVFGFCYNGVISSRGAYSHEAANPARLLEPQLSPVLSGLSGLPAGQHAVLLHHQPVLSGHDGQRGADERLSGLDDGAEPGSDAADGRGGGSPAQGSGDVDMRFPVRRHRPDRRGAAVFGRDRPGGGSGGVRQRHDQLPGRNAVHPGGGQHDAADRGKAAAVPGVFRLFHHGQLREPVRRGVRRRAVRRAGLSLDPAVQRALRGDLGHRGDVHPHAGEARRIPAHPSAEGLGGGAALPEGPAPAAGAGRLLTADELLCQRLLRHRAAIHDQHRAEAAADGAGGL